MTIVVKYFFSRARYLLKIVFCAVVWLFVAANDFAQDNLPTVQLKADFQIFENSIKEAHPGLYRYNTPSQFDSILNQAARKTGSSHDASGILSNAFACCSSDKMRSHEISSG